MNDLPVPYFRYEVIPIAFMKGHYGIQDKQEECFVRDENNLIYSSTSFWDCVEYVLAMEGDTNSQV